MPVRKSLYVCLLCLLPALASHAQEVNVARSKPTSQSSTSFRGSASRAVDGNTSGAWIQRSVTHTQREPGAWWEVDLGAEFAISRIEIWNRTDCCAQRLDRFNVLVSSRRRDTPRVLNDAPLRVTRFTRNPIQVRANDVGRFVRIQLTTDQFLSLAEVRVFGTQLVQNSGVVDVRVRYEDVDSAARVDYTPISVVPANGGGCAYRLEFDDPQDRPDNAIHEVGGDIGQLQRPVRDDCIAPGFVKTETQDRQHYEQQTAYYWIMRARDYASRHLWVTPQGWDGGPITHSVKRVDPYVLSREAVDNACWPLSGMSCFRAWPGQGARIYLRSQTVRPTLVAHEFGHYAAGFVFGHMDTFSFDIGQCAKRSFQEVIAEMFLTVFLHSEELDHYAADDPLGNGRPRSEFPLAATDVWDDQCGTGGNDYVMGRPLAQAFHKSVWDGVWIDAAQANAAMVDAFSYALASNHGHRMDDLAQDILTQLERTHPGEAPRVRAIFADHGFLSVGDACSTNVGCTGPRTTRCDTTRFAESRCIPDDGVGQVGDYCTHNQHCQNANCVGATPAYGGTCEQPGGIGDLCETNAGCEGWRTGRCDRTVWPYTCIPDDGRGRRNEYCTHNNQCDASRGLVCQVSSPGGSGVCR